jgi:hypothetical protein
MTERQNILRWGGASGILAGLILTAMLAVGLAAGPNSAQLLQPTDPALVSELMSQYSGPVQASILLDDLFALAYTGAFLGLAALVWPRSRWLASVAMIFALATAVLDFSENARLLSMAQGVGGLTQPCVNCTSWASSSTLAATWPHSFLDWACQSGIG